MAVFKCKMCGGALEVVGNITTITCEYCGSQQTLPRLNDDKVERLYDRANHFRRNNEFDKATEIYEQILNENNEDAESYWALVLCRYGIEYVEDPVSHKRIPTINRAQFTSIFDDDNYRLALKYADVSQKIIYEQEAAAINEIQKGILQISQNEEPFDVFICYKETDENGKRTYDSVYANELYHELTQEGFKVFFARITLEDKLGSAYEPYIFAALNSAKVMVVIGTKKEYFEAVWVRNEWSRFLSLIKSGEKKHLIPAYRDMNPYDLPKELSHLQSQDMNKLGFMPDLIRGIRKLVGTQPVFSQPGSSYAQQTTTHVSENKSYNVRLVSYGNEKLNCIKVVRETFGCGLKEAKDLVESRIPMLARDVSLYDAERIRDIFSANGIEVSIEALGGGASSIPNSISIPITKPQGQDTQTLLKRVAIFLEGGDWANADVYCEKVLDIDPENARAYIGKLMAKLRIAKEEDLAFSNTPLEGMMPYKNALRFADEETARRLIEYNRVIKETLERQERERQEKERREEAERQERARIEREHRQQEEKRRQEINALQAARNNITNLISGQIREKERLEGLIEKKQAEIQKLNNSKKLRRLSALVKLFTVIGIIAFIAGVAIGDMNPTSVGCLVCFLLSLLLHTIFSVKMLKADGKSGALVLINLITYCLFTIVMAFIVARKCKKGKASQLVQELNGLKAQLQQVESKIDTSRQSLNEINQKLDSHP